LETSLLVKLRRSAGAFEFVELDALGDDPGLFQLRLSLGGRSVSSLQAHLNGAEAEGLARLQDCFARNLIAVDERAIGRIQISNEDVTTAEDDFGVMARDRTFRDLEGIVRHPSN